LKTVSMLAPRQGPKMCKNKGTNLSRNLTRNQILSPRLEDTSTLEWTSDSFPGILIYMLFLENCWNSTPMCGFFSNPGDNVMISAEVSCNQDLRVEHMYNILKASALWADAFYKSKCPVVCPSVRVFVCLSVHF
jgi:hypothetical protein